MRIIKSLCTELYIVLYNNILSDLRVENPKVDYPILWCVLVNIVLLTFIYVSEFFLLKLGVPTGNEFYLGSAFTMIVAYVMALTPFFLAMSRNELASKVDVGSGVISRFILLTVSSLFAIMLFNMIFKHSIFLLFLVIEVIKINN